MNNTQEIMQQFTPTSLKEMDSVKLLNRVDSKFILSKKQLLEVLPKFAKHYKSLEINGLRSARYKSLYFDTPDFDFYNAHHNGRPDRYKVRIRKYLDSDLCFFEIKHKKKGRTDKRRIKIADFEEQLLPPSQTHLDNTIPGNIAIKTSIWNSFERITLVNNELQERLTLDIGLNFEWKGKNYGFDDIIIAEVKQETDNRSSPCRKILKEARVRQARISKYCIGMGLVHTNLKTNNFKSKYLLLDKIRKL